MHELSLVKSILERTFEISREYGDRPIRGVRIRIGSMRQVVPEALQFAFEAASGNTPAEGADFAWEVVPVEILCEGCEQTYRPLEDIWRCPGCGHNGGRLLQGDELILDSVELAETA